MKNIFPLLFISLSLVACNNDDDTDDTLVYPSEYNSASFDQNALNELTANLALGSLSDAMSKADGGNVVSETDLKSAWNLQPLKDKAPAAYTEMLDAEFQAMALASNNTFEPLDVPNGTGGHYGSRLLDHTGLELEQLIEKGYYNAGMLNEAVSILNQTNLSTADVDRVVALFGAYPAFSNSDNATEYADRYMAKYAARRTPSSGGFYLNVKQGCIQLKTALETEGDWSTEINEAKEMILHNWEMAAAATAVDYIEGGVEYLSKANLTEDDVAEGMHDLSEGIGFLWGLYLAPHQQRIATNAELATVLNTIYFDVNTSESRLYESWQSANNTLSMLDGVDQLAAIYGFTNQDLSNFRINWVSSEGRE